jgi:hypothetical protein
MLRFLLSTAALAAATGAAALSVNQTLPAKSLGFYVLLADDTTAYTSTTKWTPQLFDYQQAANVLFFTFIEPKVSFSPGLLA